MTCSGVSREGGSSAIPAASDAATDFGVWSELQWARCNAVCPGSPCRPGQVRFSVQKERQSRIASRSRYEQHLAVFQTPQVCNADLQHQDPNLHSDSLTVTMVMLLYCSAVRTHYKRFSFASPCWAEILAQDKWQCFSEQKVVYCNLQGNPWTQWILPGLEDHVDLSCFWAHRLLS